MLWLQRGLLQTKKRKRWALTVLTLDNKKQLILLGEGKCSQRQDGWKSSKFPSSIIHCILMRMQAKTIETQHRQFRHSNHLWFCERRYGEVRKTQSVRYQATKLDGPGSPIPVFKFWCFVLFQWKGWRRGVYRGKPSNTCKWDACVRRGEQWPAERVLPVKSMFTVLTSSLELARYRSLREL